LLRIHHNLMSTAGNLKGIREVFSHQQSLAQCREWLDRCLPEIRRTAVSSNSEGARLASCTPGTAAIAGEVAAPIYGLDILERNIEDEPDNTTRFLVIGRNPVGRTGSDRTSLLLSTRNHPGALYTMLEPFAHFGLSMTKIESRPSRRGLWDYVFFIDVEGHREDPALSNALQALEPNVTMLKVLGSYPRAV
jgi:chorismate mutase/prephenate dehydratase